MDKVTITVTQDHIDKGVRDDGCKCPVALAIADAFPGSCPLVSTQEIELMIDGLLMDVNLPDGLEGIIDRYDEIGLMSPFSFEIDLTEETVAIER